MTATIRDQVGYSIRAKAGGCDNGKGMVVGTYDAAGAGRAVSFYQATSFSRSMALRRFFSR
ncbi:hypothetical protein [Streptomyces sp. NPDC056549]|uniref:hypothetical protein n=1 Tax=Streptomyces sp. NPDC056549 TaxID=3345864 RepID=UPI0036773331